MECSVALFLNISLARKRHVNLAHLDESSSLHRYTQQPAIFTVDFRGQRAHDQHARSPVACSTMLIVPHERALIWAPIRNSSKPNLWAAPEQPWTSLS